MGLFKTLKKDDRDNERGIVVRNKALVAQGYTQEEGINYDEVFAPVARIEASRYFGSDASFIGFHCDVPMMCKSAFLYGTIEEEVYVCQPLGFEDPQFPDKVYKQASIETNKALVKDEEAEAVDVHLYKSMIRSLIYLIASRPDIMFVVCACVRFQVTPKMSHLHAVKRIFRFLKGQPKLGLWYPKDSLFDLEAFSDSDYVGASLDRKSTTGGCQFLGKRLISWQCKKQTIVANFTTEAEYVAAANCCGHVSHVGYSPHKNGHHSPMSNRKKELAIPGEMANAHIEQILPSPSTYHRKHRKTQKHRRAKKATELPQTSVPLDLGADEVVHRRGDSMEKAITTDASLIAAQRQAKNGISFELMACYHLHLMIHLSQEVLDLEKEKDAQAVKILKLKQRVKKLERNRKSSISHLEGGGKAGVSTAAPRTPTTITDVEDSSRPIRSINLHFILFQLLNPKDKELAQRLHEEELAELDEHQKEKQKEATNAALADEFDEIQARMVLGGFFEIVVRLTHTEQKKYTIEERATLLAEYFERRKKQLAAERAEHKEQTTYKSSSQERDDCIS
ncbi:uncharacterized mitochondrial protein-like protein [Tanacetum coccineum]